MRVQTSTISPARVESNVLWSRLLAPSCLEVSIPAISSNTDTNVHCSHEFRVELNAGERNVGFIIVFADACSAESSTHERKTTTIKETNLAGVCFQKQDWC